MNDSKELPARGLISAIVWRGVVAVGCVAVYVGMGLYLQKGHIQLSAAEACALFIAYIVYSVRENIRQRRGSTSYGLSLMR
jgi:hypothetical protein